MKHRIGFVWLLLAALLLPRPAFAAFHLMEIEQVIGGVGGDTTAQAVQLKMRSTLQQNLLGGNARLVVRDAAGNNPVTLTTFPLPNPPNFGLCREVLIATSSFASKTTPAAVVDYTMSPIPPGDLAAGSLTFEQVSTNAVLWRISWGDGGYTGPNTTDLTNGDGDNSPPFASAMPTATNKSLKYQPACATASTSNATDYAITTGAAVFVNNSLGSFTVNAPAAPIPGLPGAARLLVPVALGLAALGFAILRRRSA